MSTSPTSPGTGSPRRRVDEGVGSYVHHHRKRSQVSVGVGSGAPAGWGSSWEAGRRRTRGRTGPGSRDRWGRGGRAGGRRGVRPGRRRGLRGVRGLRRGRRHRCRRRCAGGRRARGRGRGRCRGVADRDRRRLAHLSGRLAVRRLAARRGRFLRGVRGVHAEFGQAQSPGRQDEARGDEQGAAAAPAVGGGLAVPAAGPAAGSGVVRTRVPTLVEGFLGGLGVRRRVARRPGRVFLTCRQMALRRWEFVAGRAAARAGEGAVEVPSARVAVVHDAGRLSSGKGAFLEATVKVVWGSGRGRLSPPVKLPKPLCVRPIDTPTTSSLLSRQHFERVTKYRTQ